ncbi:MAG: hypothetical protein WDO18_17100 [Acidobacteriota bacterium]
MLRDLCHVRVLQSFIQYPSEQELKRFMQVAGPAIVFLDADDTSQALPLALAIDRSGTGAQVVVFGGTCDRQVLVESMKVGVREFLSIPIEPSRLEEAVRRISEVLERKTAGSQHHGRRF